jgi:hypothetical protein
LADNGKCPQEYAGGIRCITFPNGTRKEIRPCAGNVRGGNDNSSSSETVYFSNGDIKQVRAWCTFVRQCWPSCSDWQRANRCEQVSLDGHTQYFFHSTRTTQITLPTGDNFFAFESGQKETHFADGTRRIAFPNGTVKWLS